jgi:hypothetical protein
MDVLSPDSARIIAGFALIVLSLLILTRGQ